MTYSSILKLNVQALTVEIYESKTDRDRPERE
jgi:hypothetical protein